MAIPTREGIKNTLARTTATWPGYNVMWINLREEPVVFVHGKPYVLREAARPFHNLQVILISSTTSCHMRCRCFMLNASKHPSDCKSRTSMRCGVRLFCASLFQEYSGITAERVENMEARLKLDVVCEAACYDGRLLVCRESDGGQVCRECLLLPMVFFTCITLRSSFC